MPILIDISNENFAVYKITFSTVVSLFHGLSLILFTDLIIINVSFRYVCGAGGCILLVYTCI